MFDFFKIIFKHYFDPLKDSQLELVKEISEQVFQVPISERSLTNILTEIAQSDKLGQMLINRIKDYLEGGLYYGVFDRDDQLGINEGEIITFNLQKFDDEEYIRNNFPSDSKLIDEFEYGLNTMQSVKAAIVLAVHHIILHPVKKNKIFVIDNIDEIINLKYYQHLIKSLAAKINTVDGIFLMSVNTDKVIELKQDEVPQTWLNEINTSLILPAESLSHSIGKLLNLGPGISEKLSSMSKLSRMFLIKQDNRIVNVELSIEGLPGLTRILCSKKEERMIYQEVIKNRDNIAQEDWIEELYNEFSKHENY
jgi:type IV secretory pathway VirB4 component